MLVNGLILSHSAYSVMTSESDMRRVAIELTPELLLAIDGLKSRLGLRTRGEVVRRLLNEVFFGGEDK